MAIVCGALRLVSCSGALLVSDFWHVRPEVRRPAKLVSASALATRAWMQATPHVAPERVVHCRSMHNRPPAALEPSRYGVACSHAHYPASLESGSAVRRPNGPVCFCPCVVACGVFHRVITAPLKINKSTIGDHAGDHAGATTLGLLTWRRGTATLPARRSMRMASIPWSFQMTFWCTGTRACDVRLCAVCALSGECTGSGLCARQA